MASETRLRQFSILIVEDDRLMMKLVYDVLIKLGFGQIFKAHTGREALSVMDRHPMDFVICDWRIPGMDGIEFTKTVRGSAKAYALVPIIMLTGNAEKHHVIHARDAGINEYLIKPFTVKDLCSRLKEIIEHPREFVLAPGYKGPSRRRKAAPGGVQTERRKRILKPQPAKAAHGRQKS
jgi:two-component system, chemotaxis family, chemotaxis protein CheY